MFDVWNSTFRLDNLRFYANTPDTAVGLIRSSTFVVSRCEITSCADTCPFVIGDSRIESSVSVSIISCSHHSSSESPSLLPLVSGPASFSPSTSDGSDGGDNADTFGVGSVSIVGSGLTMKSQHLVVGTGPLFDFGSFIGSGLCGIVGCSVSLSTSSLTNTTSTLLPPRTAPSCSFLTQRLIGVSVLESTNHLCGTSGLSLDWAGSSLLSNCSFSSCTTNSAPSPIAEPTQDPSKEYTTHISKSSRISHEQHYEDEAVRNPVWIVSCAFSDLSASTYGAAVSSIHYRADYVVKDTSFVRCRTTDSVSTGGALFLMHNNDSSGVGKFSFTLFNCWFSNNTGTRGGHFKVQFLHPLTIAKCTFEDSRSKTASPLKQENPIRIFIVGDCRFDNSTVSNNEGYRTGGIWLKQYQALGSVVLTDILFDDNVCTNTTQGNHVYDYMIDGDIGVMKSGTALVVVFSVDFLQNEGLIDVDVFDPFSCVKRNM
ncbi:hypothetical protein BLNAU_6111 [Blattamonas nauphoetae]|uniref:Uncharacterized protein n=1 Tax=Blattamonas nauphoetae TaxID=2049346 RepID=A0ABQ9Y537_9EUKA|nr:hypothetical protein BLNAU_6111 [Blattamonas nauphoetae]